MDAGNAPGRAPRTKLLTSYKTLFGTGAFNCYLLMLIGGLAGIAVFEACSGVLMGAVLGLSSMAVSILFILPIPAAFFGAWFAGRPNKRFPTLMWQSVICCLLAGLMMWIPGLLGIMTVWTLLVPAALFFFGAGMLFPLATSGAMETVPVSRRNRRGPGGRLAEYRLRRAGLVVGDDAANWSGQPRPADDADGPVDSAVLAAAGLALHPPSAAGISTAVVPRMAADALSGLPDESSAGPRKAAPPGDYRTPSRCSALFRSGCAAIR